MLKWVIAKGTGAVTLILGAVIAVADNNDYLTNAQIAWAIAGFLVLALVSAILNVKPSPKALKMQAEKKRRNETILADVASVNSRSERAASKVRAAQTLSAPPDNGPRRPMFNPHEGPAVVLARHPRLPDFDVTRDGSSWFGGCPALGAADWPRAQSGVPMTPLAQLDLAHVTAKISMPGLPSTGALAFFLNFAKGPLQGAVRYVPSPADQPTTQPTGLSPLENGSFGGPLLRGNPAETQLLFPRMAVEMVGLTGAETSNDHTFRARIDDQLGLAPEHNLSVAAFPTQFPHKNMPLNRDSVTRFMAGAAASLLGSDKAQKELEKQLIMARKRIIDLEPRLPDLLANANAQSSNEAARDKLRQTQTLIESATAGVARMDREMNNFDEELASLSASVTVLKDWASRGNRWALLTDAEQSEIAPLLAPWTEYGALGYLHLNQMWDIHRHMDSASGETLRVMAVAPASVYEALPQIVQSALNGPYRQPIRRSWHQMFGPPASIQTAAEDHCNDYLLLQITSDDLQRFAWGDAGVLQFWIAPDDLRAGNWGAVTVTMEGH